MIIPHQQLNADVLRGLIENFIAREGTDYGEIEFSMDQKVAQVMAQLKAGTSVITYDQDTESCDIKDTRKAQTELQSEP